MLQKLNFPKKTRKIEHHIVFLKKTKT